MRGRAVILAAGAFLLSGAATAQTTDEAKQSSKANAKAAKAAAQADAIPSEPDPLTPPEAQGPPPSAPVAADAVPAETPASPASATVQVAAPDAALIAVRQALAAPRGRENAADAADRAALTAFYSEEAAHIHWTNAQGFTPRAVVLMDEIRKADDWGLRASAFDLPKLSADPTDDARADAEVKLGLAALKYARHARGGRMDPGSVSKLFDRKAQVYEPGSLIKSIASSAAPDAYLRSLHPKHAGFRNLQKALVALRTAPAQAAPVEAQAQPEDRRGQAKAKRPAQPASSSDMIRRIVANMERWRWMPDDLGAFHVWNNVPEQITTVYNDGKVVFQERIVVGAAATPTPNFTANMQFVIFQPEWGVPGGIKNNEIAPMLRRASASSGDWFGFGDTSSKPSAVLARHGLRVSLGNQVINPDSVNWSSVDINRFNFIQPAGPTNVLGVVKFRFPNKHDVYMHDTPQRNLFAASQRAFSHGCMRVQNPVRFAEVLLEHDKGWASDRVRGMVPRGGEVKLTTTIPVHNVYFTAVADEHGKVHSLSDIYGTDSRVASALEGRSVAVASRSDANPSEPAAANANAGDRQRGQRQTQVRRRGQDTASSGFINPFSGLFGN